eukprot:jgi/Bigna1/67903/fgenesh1_pg.4_\
MSSIRTLPTPDNNNDKSIPREPSPHASFLPNHSTWKTSWQHTSMESKLDLTVVFNKGEKVLPLQLSGDTLVSTLKRLVAAEVHVPVSDQKVFYKGSALTDTKTIKQSGIQDKDVIEVQGVSLSQSLTSLSQIPQHIWQNPAQLQETIKGNPKLLNQLLHQNPTLATAVMSNNTFMLEQYFIEQRRAREAAKRKEDMEISRLQANPLDPDSQKRIQEIIREKNIRENMERAIEHNPESFGSVIMLYIPWYSRKALGIACIDLKDNCLRIQGQNVKFLSEKDIPKNGIFQDAKGGRGVGSTTSSRSSSSGTRSVAADSKQSGPRGKKQKVGGSSSSSSSSSSGMETEASSPPTASNSRPDDSEYGASGLMPTFMKQQHLATLISMGFSPAMALEALTVSGGNVELAAAYLFTRVIFFAYIFESIDAAMMGQSFSSKANIFSELVLNGIVFARSQFMPAHVYAE